MRDVSIFSMATVNLRLSLTRPVPMGILALAMRLETIYFVKQLTPVIEELSGMRKDVSDLLKRCEILGERVERLQHRTEDLISDIQPLIADFYNLCGDPDCDGSCLVCCDGEYLGEEESYEKYCKRGRR